MSKFSFKDVKDVRLKDYVGIWKSNGVYIDDNQEDHFVPMEDALVWDNSTKFFPVSVETMVREAMEPVLVGSNLLDTIQYQPGLQMSFPSIGAITAEDIDQTGEYPEYTLNYGEGVQIITIGKSGLAIKFSEEIIRYSQYDVLGQHLKAMGRALARHKESKIWAMLSQMGVPTHDNVNQGDAVFGSTTGMDYDGTQNGSITMDDIFQAYGQVLMNGFVPNALIVHPLTYTMFMTDPVMRAFALNHGGGQWFNGWQGAGNVQYPWSQGLLGKRGPGLSKESSSSDPKDLAVNAKFKLPDYVGIPLQIIVSPFVPYNHASKLTDIYMVDTNNIGAIVVDELPVMDEIPDRLRDIKKIKIRERYSLAPYHEGNAVAVIKNVKVITNKLVLPVQASTTLSTFPDQTGKVLNADGTVYSSGQ